MKKFLTLITCLLLITFLLSCSQPPNFTKEVTVIRKTSYLFGSVYTLKPDDGIRGKGTGTVKFWAPEQFAKVGDVIIFEDGVLKVKEK